MVATFENNTEALSTVQKCEMNSGREGTYDTTSGRPAASTIKKNIDRVYTTVTDDRRLTINQNSQCC